MSTDHPRRCRRLIERLSRFIDGDLSAVERRAVALHLRRCPCCHEFAASLRRTVRVCREAGQATLPGPVRARARRRIRELLARNGEAGAAVRRVRTRRT